MIFIATDMKLQGFYLDKDNETQLNDYSITTGISKSEIVRRALRLYLGMYIGSPCCEVTDDPKDIYGAKDLAKRIEDGHYQLAKKVKDGHYQFGWWALGKVGASPAQDMKKGADRSIDGYIYFIDDNSGIAKKIIVQVKNGHVKAGDILALKGVLEREKAAIGAYITLQEPKKSMKEEAASAGFYVPKYLPDKHYPKVQILTIEELLQGKQLEYPRVAPEVTFKKAKHISKVAEGEQDRLFKQSNWNIPE